MENDSIALKIVDIYLKGTKTNNQQIGSFAMLPAVVIKNARALKVFNQWKSK